MSLVSATQPSLSNVIICPLLSNVEMLLINVALMVIISLTKNFLDKSSLTKILIPLTFSMVLPYKSSE